jgi:hypothetical protein
MGSHREVEAIDRQGTPRTKMAMILIMFRVGQNRLHAPYMTVYSVISLPEIPCIHRIYKVLANSTNIRSYTVYIYTILANPKYSN